MENNYKTTRFYYTRMILSLSVIATLLLICVVPTNLTAAEFGGSLTNISITDTQGVNIPPIASFTYSLTGNTVTFDASGSSDTDGSLVEYKWDFGDNNKGTGATTSHTYSNLANLAATLTIIDNDGGVSLKQEPIITGACSATPFLDIPSQTANRQLISSDTYAYVGGRYLGTSLTLCKTSFLIRTWVGVPTTDTRIYEARIYSMNGDNLDQLKGTSDGVPGSNFDTNITFHDFTFSPPIDIATGDAIVITEQAQTVDSNSFIRTYNNGQANRSISFGTWDSSRTKTFTSLTTSPSIKLYSYE